MLVVVGVAVIPAIGACAAQEIAAVADVVGCVFVPLLGVGWRRGCASAPDPRRDKVRFTSPQSPRSPSSAGPSDAKRPSQS